MSTPHVSIATAIEKNRIASATAFVLLLDVQVTDDLGNLIETLHLAKNSENVIWQGNEYTASNFDAKLDLTSDSTPKFVITAQDPTGFLRSRMETYSGGVGFPVTMTVVNTANLAQEPEIQETFEVIGSSASGYVVSFTMGVENPLMMRFPQRIEWRDQCPFVYKGPRCKYAGTIATCDFTYFGPNGCKVHANEINYGGFLGLQTINVSG